MRVSTPSNFRIQRQTVNAIISLPATIDSGGSIITGTVPVNVVVGQWGFCTGDIQVQKDGTPGIIRGRFVNVGTCTAVWNHDETAADEITTGDLPANAFWVPMLSSSFRVTVAGTLLIDLQAFSLTATASLTRGQMAMMLFPPPS